MFKVEWDQWYRCGRYGDDKDYDTQSVEFATLSEAESFVEDLVAGKHRGFADCTVHRNEVKISEC